MATRKKAAKGKLALQKNTTKNAAAKKSSSLGKRGAKDTPPIRIIVEGVVVVRIEGPGFSASSVAGGLLGGGPDPNFSYSFEVANGKILSLIVESYSKDNPPPSGSFYTPVLDPNDPQQVRVIVVATQYNPGPSGSLSLKYKGKDLAANPIAINFSGGKG